MDMIMRYHEDLLFNPVTPIFPNLQNALTPAPLPLGEGKGARGWGEGKRNDYGVYL
jgi:hypothetical protein